MSNSNIANITNEYDNSNDAKDIFELIKRVREENGFIKCDYPINNVDTIKKKIKLGEIKKNDKICKKRKHKNNILDELGSDIIDNLDEDILEIIKN
jgi:hypothetical protein